MSVKGSSSKEDASKEDLSMRVRAIDKEVKIPIPKPCNGERSKLKGLLIQVDLYLSFHSSRFTSDTRGVLWIVTLLEGRPVQLNQFRV